MNGPPETYLSLFAIYKGNFLLLKSSVTKLSSINLEITRLIPTFDNQNVYISMII